jgi:hypothetical protein
LIEEAFMKLLMDYIVADSGYQNLKFRCITGETGGPGAVDDPPKDTGVPTIDPKKDSDILVFSFMNGAQPFALLCKVATDFGTGTSTSRYYVCQPTISGTPLDIAWQVVAGGTNGFTLVFTDSEGTNIPCAGNPHGVAQAGASLGIIEYDSPEDVTSLYTVAISALLAGTSGETVTVTRTIIDSDFLPQDPGVEEGEEFKVHGNGLIVLTDPSASSSGTFFFAQFNGAVEDEETHMPISYVESTVVRITTAATPAVQTSVAAGKNAMGMVPLPIAASGTTSASLALAVPCLGGLYQYGTTNGTDSILFRINNIFASMTATAAIIGVAGGVPASGTRDIKSVAFSDDGLVGYLLCLTYDANYKPCWKIYQTTAAKILAASNVSIGTPGNVLTFLTGQDAAKGNDWELLYENAADPANGRLWFVQGTTIQVSQGNNYGNKHILEKLYNDDDPVVDGYVNSADLIREMIYQYEKGQSIDTRLIKNKTVAKIAKAAAARAATAPEEEEEEK